MINGVTQLLMMKADVLSIFPQIKICTQYKLGDGTITDQVPYEQINENITPIYEEMKGWNCSLKNLIEANLPIELKKYVEFLEEKLEVPISLISTVQTGQKPSTGANNPLSFGNLLIPLLRINFHLLPLQSVLEKRGLERQKRLS